MKSVIEKLKCFRGDLSSLKKDVRDNGASMINKSGIRSKAEALARQRTNEFGDHLKQFDKLPEKTITDMNENMSTLFRLSQQSNRKTSYTRVLDAAYRRFNVRFVVPISQSTPVVKVGFDFHKLFPNISDPQESEYMKEAVGCANEGYFRAAVVVGWCATMHRIHNCVRTLGIEKINEHLRVMREAKHGKFKQVRSAPPISTLGEVQEITDCNLILLILQLGLIDAKQADRLIEHLNHRNQSAHPGDAPVGEELLNHFFPGIGEIIFNNSNLSQT